MASPQSECRRLLRRPLLLVALARGLRTTASPPKVDQAVTSSPSFLAEALLHRQTLLIDARRASTAVVNCAIVMHNGGIRTTTFEIGLVRRPWHRASMQTAAAMAGPAASRESCISTPAIN